MDAVPPPPARARRRVRCHGSRGRRVRVDPAVGRDAPAARPPRQRRHGAGIGGSRAPRRRARRPVAGAAAPRWPPRSASTSSSRCRTSRCGSRAATTSAASSCSLIVALIAAEVGIRARRGRSRGTRVRVRPRPARAGSSISPPRRRHRRRHLVGPGRDHRPVRSGRLRVRNAATRPASCPRLGIHGTSRARRSSRPTPISCSRPGGVEIEVVGRGIDFGRLVLFAAEPVRASLQKRGSRSRSPTNSASPWPPRIPLTALRSRRGPISPVRTRMTSSTGEIHTLPSPIWPVRAASTIASATRSASPSSASTSIRTLGTNSTVYSAPRYTSVWPRWRPKPAPR